MTDEWHSAFARIVRRLRPAAERYGAAAAVYGPELMLELKATLSAGNVSQCAQCDGPTPPAGLKLVSGDHPPGLDLCRSIERLETQDDPPGDLEGAHRCPAR